MQIHVQYEAQVRRAAGIRSQTMDVPEGTHLQACIHQIAGAHGDRLKPVLLNDDNEVQISLLIFVNDQHVRGQADCVLSDGDTLTLMTPISGG